jgi:hypothetical protein
MAKLFSGRKVSATAPTSGQVMTWNATTKEWTPTTPTSSPGGAHAATHATGQDDAVAPSAIGAASVSALEGHTGNSNNPHSTTAAQTGAATTSALTAHTEAAAPHTGHAASTHAHSPGDVTGTAVIASDFSAHTGATTAAHGGVLASTALSGVAKITVGATAPVGPTTGDLWIDVN